MVTWLCNSDIIITCKTESVDASLQYNQAVCYRAYMFVSVTLPRGGDARWLQGKVIAYWSNILPNEVIIGLAEVMIEPCMFATWTRGRDVIITWKVSSVHASVSSRHVCLLKVFWKWKQSHKCLSHDLIVIGLAEIEIKPSMFFTWPIGDDVSVNCKVKPSSIWLL